MRSSIAKKRNAVLTKAVRDERKKNKKFHERKNEAIKACQSLKKAVQTSQTKLREKAKEVGPIVNRFNVKADDGLFFMSNSSESERGNPNFQDDIDFSDLLDTIQSVIDDLKEVSK